MGEWKRIFTFTFFLGLVITALGRPQEPIILENSELRVSLSPQNATVLSVHHKKTNASYLGSSKQAGWFRIQIPLPYWEGHAAASDDLKAVNVKQLGPEAVEFHATELLSKEGTQPVSFKLAMRLEGDNLVCKLSFENRSQQTIDRIIFPILGVPAATDAKEALLIPTLRS